MSITSSHHTLVVVLLCVKLVELESVYVTNCMWQI